MNFKEAFWVTTAIALPATAVCCFVDVPRGIALYMLAALLGFLALVGNINWNRTARLGASMVVARNVPGVQHVTEDWVDNAPEKSPRETPRPMPGFMTRWFTKPREASGSMVLVIAGIVCGLIVTAVIGIHDLNVEAAKEGWVLPLRGVRDSLMTQAFLIAIPFAIWGAMLGGIMTSAYYRIAIAICVFVFAYLGVMVSFGTGFIFPVLSAAICTGTAGGLIGVIGGLGFDLSMVEETNDPLEREKRRLDRYR